MSFEAVLGNQEFELVVFGVTFAVVANYAPEVIIRCQGVQFNAK
jgi:hypothetical protein